MAARLPLPAMRLTGRCPVADVTPEAADWVYEHVLTAAYRDGAAFEIRHCPCDWGTCTSCRYGDHRHCAHAALAPHPSTNTYIRDRAGVCVVECLTGRFAVLWPIGSPCVWRCACSCAGPVGAQLELFALAGGAR